MRVPTRTIQFIEPSYIIQAAGPNERALEVALMQDFLRLYTNIVEVGAVSPVYFNGIQHPIVDPFDPYEGCIRVDGEKYDYTDKSVLCISTVEHMGRADYGNTDLDDQKGIRFLNKVLDEARNYLITWPVASNKDLDEWVYGSSIPWRLYVRISGESPVWALADGTQQEIIAQARRLKYNDPYPNGNGLIVVDNVIKHN